MTFTPIGSLVLVKKIAKPAPKEGEFFIPNPKEERILQMEIVKIGTKDIPAEIVPGKIVLTDFHGMEIQIEDEKHYLLEVEHVLAVIE